MPGHPRRRVHQPRVPVGHDRARRALVARAEQAAPDDDRRLAEDGRLRRHEQRAGARSSTPASTLPRPGDASASTSSRYRTGDIVSPRVDGGRAALPRAGGLLRGDPHRRATPRSSRAARARGRADDRGRRRLARGRRSARRRRRGHGRTHVAMGTQATTTRVPFLDLAADSQRPSKDDLLEDDRRPDRQRRVHERPAGRASSRQAFAAYCGTDRLRRRRERPRRAPPRPARRRASSRATR